MVLIKDRLPVLIDTGFGSDVKETERLIRQAGAPPEKLGLIVNTHYHSDHVGGNFHFQKNYGIEIAGHKWEADLVNGADAEACSSEWLDQPVEPSRVDRKLSDNEEIETGSRTLQVLHTPGHTLGHISLYDPEEKILIAGDLFHQSDIGWLNIFREGAGAIHRSMESLERLSTSRFSKLILDMDLRWPTLRRPSMRRGIVLKNGAARRKKFRGMPANGFSRSR